MPRSPSRQVSFFSPEFADPDCIEVGTLPWLLARRQSLLFPEWLFAGWSRKGKPGPDGWPAALLMSLLLMRWSEEGMGARAAVRRAKRDTTWRAALGLEIGGKTPCRKCLRNFERFLLRRHPDSGVPRYLVVHEHFVRLNIDAGVLGNKPVWAMDSTPMWAYGASLDTIRQLGDGLRMLARRWAKWRGTSVSALATEWEAPLLLAKSTKGSYRIDWRNPEERAAVVASLASTALRVVDRVRSQVEVLGSGKRKGALRSCRHLLKVICDNLETDEHGRLVVAKKVARDRLVSITDPQARHGRKSKSKTFKGFKIHVLGDVVSGLLLSLAVTSGDSHDGTPAHRLIRRAKEQCGEIERVLADTAYGGARLRHVVAGAEGVRLVAPPPPVARKPGKLGRDTLQIDLEVGTATCKADVTTEDMRWSWVGKQGTHVRRFRWPKETCTTCRLQSACCSESRLDRGHEVRLHAYEEELVDARRAWDDPKVRRDYRTRSQCERLVNQITRHGGRQARAWGLGSANLQAHTIAMRCNLELLARSFAAAEAAAAYVG